MIASPSQSVKNHVLALVLLVVPFVQNPLFSAEIFLSPSGNDANPGTSDRPIATLHHAQELARTAKTSGSVSVILREGIYYLNEPIVFNCADSGTAQAPVVYRAYANERPVLSGGLKLQNLDWKPYKNGIMQTAVPADLHTDQLFVNGERQVLARYPNIDPKQLIFHGSAADAISPERVTKWADPTGGFFHTMHPALWGGFSYLITGKDAQGNLLLEGGWQNNRPGGAVGKFVGEPKGIHQKYRMVENIFEELDAPGEWFLNTKTHTLYFYPPTGHDLNKATIEAVRLRELVEFQGNEKAPVKFIALKGLTFRHTLRTFMENRERLLRTDWTVYRGGAIFVNGAEDCSLEECLLDQLGGNAIFVNNYNRRIMVRGSEIVKAGGNGIAFVGDPNAARNALIGYDSRQKFNDIDLTPGPKTSNYPADCLVDDCLIHETGYVEKQTAGIEIDLAQNITIRHCSIYDMPRAGINIGDGCWGGHVIEGCDIFDTVKETGDHGSFNAWGRDRWWALGGVDLNKDIAATQAELPRLDAVKTTILRNNRWRCDHGWDIDLDDGSSNYEIINNLCLNGGIKNREGFYRTVENNIMNNFHPHVWYADSQDVFKHNILFGGYSPAGMNIKPWGKEMDFNFVQKNGATNTQPAVSLQQKSGRDEHSITGDAQFIDPASGNYQVKEESPALALGFVNFPMDQFGVQKPGLKAISRTPELPTSNGKSKEGTSRDGSINEWNGIQVRNIRDEGEMSVYGTPGVTGVLVVKLGGSPAISGLAANDVIIEVNKKPILSVSDLLKPENLPTGGKPVEIKLLRSQQPVVLSVGK